MRVLSSDYHSYRPTKSWIVCSRNWLVIPRCSQHYTRLRAPATAQLAGSAVYCWNALVRFPRAARAIMLPVMPLRRRSKIIFVAGALVVGLAALIFWAMLDALGGRYHPAGSTQVGAYTIKSETAEFMGHTGRRQTLFLRQPGGDYLIAKWLGESTVSPHDPAKIIYRQYCDPDDPQQDCGVYYFNGSTRAKWKIAPAGASFSPDEQTWSAEGHTAFLDLNIGRSLAFVELDSGRVTHVKVGPNTERPPWRSVRLLGWSPDHRQAAVEVRNLWTDVESGSIQDVDLYSVDPFAGVVTYVGSLQRQPQSIHAEPRWLPSSDTFDLVLDSAYRKQKGEFLTF